MRRQEGSREDIIVDLYDTDYFFCSVILTIGRIQVSENSGHGSFVPQDDRKSFLVSGGGDLALKSIKK